MSNEKTTQAKPEKAKPEKAKKTSVFSKIGRYFRDLRSEFKKIVWPSKKQIINNTVVVLICMAITVFAIWILVLAFLNLFALIY